MTDSSQFMVCYKCLWSDYSSIPLLLSIIGGILVIKSKKLKTKEKWANRWLTRNRETEKQIF